MLGPAVQEPSGEPGRAGREASRPARRRRAALVEALARPVVVAVAAAWLCTRGAIAVAEPTRAEPVTLLDLAERARGILARVAQERAAAARRPVPVPVRWAPRRIATLELPGGLGALAGADLDGDGAEELYAVTERAVVVYEVQAQGQKLRERQRLPLPGREAAIRPRDTVATVAVDPQTRELLAGSSAMATSLRARWRDGALVVVEEFEGLPLCAHRRGTLAPGRNTFVVAEPAGGQPWRARAGELFGERCRDVVLSDGRRAEASARLEVDGPLEVTVTPACTPACPPRRYELGPTGVAFDVGDVDRDGRLEVAYAGAGAPGDPDAVRVIPVADPRRTLFRRAFAGGVAALTLMDLDGNGAAEVVVAVRLVGSSRVDVWRLN